ncbi:TPA: hypothetical protein KQG29_001494 [Clostridioides difficile]|nr:hypothetical protein [Clostridioides difficile]
MDFTGVIRNSFSNVLLFGEYAGSILGITNFPDNYVIVQSECVDTEIETDYFTVYPVQKLDLNYTGKLRDDVWITNEARTICDMIKDDREFGFIQEAIDEYIINNEKGVEHYKEVLDVARHYNIESKVMATIDYAKSHEYYEEN